MLPFYASIKNIQEPISQEWGLFGRRRYEPFIKSMHTTCRSRDRDSERRDNKTNVSALKEQKTTAVAFNKCSSD
jgi:hypothetical protein